MLVPRWHDGPLATRLGQTLLLCRLDALWRRAKGKAMVEGLNFHDLRREATTRLAKRLDVMELARVTGHRDLKTLHSIYYSPSVEDIADKLD